MTERLSDERLLELRRVPTAQPWSEVREMIDELIELRAKLSAGPVMPEVPSEGVLSAAATAEYVGGSPIECFYHAFRDALAAEQKERDR